jgi:hypothetical protein
MTALERKTKKLRNALREIYGDESPETLITDALADMRHLCDADDVSFSEVDRIAQDHYLTEKNTQMRFQFEDA